MINLPRPLQRRGVPNGLFSEWNVLSGLLIIVSFIIVTTSSILPRTSSFVKRITSKPCFLRWYVLSSSETCWSSMKWYPPSTSTTNRFLRHTKSGMYPAMGCWRRKRTPSCPPRRHSQSIDSASVAYLLLLLALRNRSA